MYGVWAPCKFFFSFFFCLLTILISFLDYNYLVTTGPAPLSHPMPATTTTTATGQRHRACACHTPLRAPARRVDSGCSIPNHGGGTTTTTVNINDRTMTPRVPRDDKEGDEGMRRERRHQPSTRPHHWAVFFFCLFYIFLLTNVSSTKS
jgi:hypothetical protein